MKRFLLTASSLVIFLGISAHAASLADTIAANPNLSTFNSLLDQTGLKATLGEGAPHTVFAPNNDAFTQIPANQLSQVTGSPGQLLKVLRYHIAAGLYTSAQIISTAPSTTRPNFMSVDGIGYDMFSAASQPNGAVNIYAAIVTPDIAADGNNIQIISRVLNPAGQNVFGPEATLPPPRP